VAGLIAMPRSNSTRFIDEPSALPTDGLRMKYLCHA